MLRFITAGVEIITLAVIFYYILIFIRQTGSIQALLGFVMLGLAFILAKSLRLHVLASIFTLFFPFLFLAFVILFQSEIRRALAELGRHRIFSSTSLEARIIEEVMEATLELSRKKIGGLIAVQRDISLGSWVQSGVVLDSRVSRELLQSIFMPGGALHDGGVIVEGDRIKAAACSFPFSQKRHFAANLGMRHKAALGLAEASDALVIVISEETGTVSVAFKGKLTRNLEEAGLRSLLEKNIHFKKKLTRQEG